MYMSEGPTFDEIEGVLWDRVAPHEGQTALTSVALSKTYWTMLSFLHFTILKSVYVL